MAAISTRSASGYTNREKKRGGRLALPALVWLLVFFVAPLIIVLAVSFMTRGTRDPYTLPLTLEHYGRVLGPIYRPVFTDSIVIAVQTTVICLILGYPLAFFISTRKSFAWRQITLFLVILPFWTNFLVRTYAWRVILGNEGILNAFMLNLGLITEPLALLNTRGAVLIGLVYGFLPFMILPIYASIERFEFRLVEAAYDLGANDWKTFWRVVLPLTMPGVVAGCILVLIPAIGSFITPDLLGGTQGLMIGNLISSQFRGTGNWPLGSASSIIMMIIVMVVLIGYAVFNRRRAA
jgi:spermidine/putrescine transport system permease protein